MEKRGNREWKKKKECLNCGKKFIPTCHITQQKFCSDNCRHRYNNAKRHYHVPVNVCPECGDTVEQREGSSGRWRRFCSDQCRSTYHHKKILDQRRSRANPKQVCPNCGKEFQPEWGAGSQRKFCCDACRIEWWTEYRKANPSEEPPAREFAFCGAPLTGKQQSGRYCSRFCYLLAMDQTHVEETFERNDQYVHGVGRAAGHYPLPSEARPIWWERLCILRQRWQYAEVYRMGWLEFSARKEAGAKWDIPLAGRAAGKRSGIERERVYLFAC